MATSWHVAILGFLLISCSLVRADGGHTFQWTFADNFLSTQITECQTLKLTTEPLNTSSTSSGIPPFYMIAFEVEGIPTTTLIGSDPNNLSWQNVHRRGSSLMFTIVDSHGNVGGIPQSLYTVTAGSDTSCLPTSTPDPSSLPLIKPNITDKIQTCQPWGLTVTGGKKPYQVVLSALDSQVITNVTMGLQDDVFTFIDRADPNKRLMASVLDADGHWGVSSPTILPYGSSDVDCVGLVSSSKTSAEIAQEAADAAKAKAQADQHRRIVIGVCVAVAIVAVIALSFGLWWYMKRKSDRENGIWDQSELTPRAWHPPEDTYPYMQEGGYTSGQPSLGAKITGATSYHAVGESTASVPPVYFDHNSQQWYMSSQAGTASSSVPPPSPSPDIPMSARERKEREALQARRQAAEGPARRPSAFSIADIGQSSSTPLDPDVQPDIIVQHRDGGAGIVHELPPPYADRTLLQPSSPTTSSSSASRLPALSSHPSYASPS
ncbi:hypothetical protein BDW22DRAFT_373449 [Trametopsis cervina]|nr:hypothetical protein BDW22DRAFT_373449 [Trametopsis cervina]